jgi:hypothetical protein
MPQVVRGLDVSGIPGQATAVSVSDDGALVLMRFVDSGRANLWTIDASGVSRPLSIDQPAAATFLANRKDAIVSEDRTQTTFLIFDVAGAATQIPLVSAIDGISGVSSVAASTDGARVFLADARSGSVAVVDVTTGTSKVLSCGCVPSGFFPLNGNSIFRLSGASRDPVMVLDASAAEPRIVIIPPHGPEAR